MRQPDDSDFGCDLLTTLAQKAVVQCLPAVLPPAGHGMTLLAIAAALAQKQYLIFAYDKGADRVADGQDDRSNGRLILHSVFHAPM